MVTQQELAQQQEEQQRIANQSIPQRRLGSRVTRRVQMQVIQQKQTAVQNLQAIEQTERQLQQQQEEQRRQENIKRALRTGIVGGSGLNREDRERVAAVLAGSGRTAGELAAQRAAQSKALEGGQSTIGGQEVIVTPQGKVTAVVIRDTRGNVSEVRSVVPEGGQTTTQGKEIVRFRDGSVATLNRDSKGNIVSADVSNPSGPRLTVSNASPGQDASISERVQNRLSQLRSTGSQAEKFGAGFGQVFYSQAVFIADLFTQPITTVSNTFSYLGSKARILISGEGVVFPEIAKVIQQEPEFSTGAYLANIAIQKAPEVIIASSDLIRTIGLTEIETTKIVAPEYFAGQRYPKIREGQTAQQLLEEFNVPALPDEQGIKAGFNASPSPFKKSTMAGKGSSELYGLYIAPRLSATFLRISGETDKIFGLNPLGTLRPSSLRIRTPVIKLLENVKEYQIDFAPLNTELLSKFGGGYIKKGKKRINYDFGEPILDKGKAYVPFIKNEKEAVIPFGSALELIDKRFFFSFEGRKVPIFEYTTSIDEVITVKTEKVNKEFTSRYYPISNKPLTNPLDIYPASYTNKNPTSYVSNLISNKSYLSNVSKSSYYSNIYSSNPSQRSYNQPSLVSKNYTPYSTSSLISTGYPKLTRYPGYPIVPTLRVPTPRIKKPSNNNPVKRYSNFVIGYKTFVIKGGKKEYLPGIRTKGFALAFGEEEAVTTLRATFGVEKTSVSVTGTKFNYLVDPNEFRSYKIKSGKKIPLMDTFIQKKGKRLSSPTEVFAIQQARRKR